MDSKRENLNHRTKIIAKGVNNGRKTISPELLSHRKEVPGRGVDKTSMSIFQKGGKHRRRDARGLGEGGVDWGVGRNDRGGRSVGIDFLRV